MLIGSVRPAFVVVCRAALLILSLSCASARAQSVAAHSPASSTSSTEETVLVRMLQGGRSFRVRARAALSLARFESTDVAIALEGALSDKHPAVRAAAAGALAQNGNRRSVSALRDAAGDREQAVALAAKTALHAIASRSKGDRTAESAAASVAFAQSAMTRLRRAQHVVVLGEMHDRSPSRSRELSELLGEQVGAALAKVDRVAVLHAHELTGEAREEIAKKKLAVLRLEGNLQSVEPVLSAGERRVRCEVSVLLLDEGTGALRSMMRGAASAVAQRSGSGAAQERELAKKALRSAVQTAMSTAQEAIRRAENANESAPEPSEETAFLTKQRR